MDLVWEPPGPGPWVQDRAHTPVAQSIVMQEAYPEPFERGFEETFSRYGALLDRLAMRCVNGYIYHQVQPFDMPGPNGPPSHEELGAEIGRRAGVAGAALEQRLWRNDLERWDNELKPAAVARHRELYGRDLGSLSTDDLVAHVRECSDHLQAMVYQHHRFNVPALLPIGMFALKAAELTHRPPTAMFGVLDGYSPVSSVVSPELEVVVDALAKDPGGHELLTGEGDAGERLSKLGERIPAVKDYVADVGYRVVDGFDIVNPTLGERPELILDRIAAAMTQDREAARARSDAFAATLREAVAGDAHAVFDELLADARLMYRLRDERGIYSDVSAIGLMRLALLEVGRRAVADGQLSDAASILDASVDEAVDIATGGGPDEADLNARTALRTSLTVEDVPRILGPPPPDPPPMDGLPEPLITVMSAAGFAIEGVLGQLDEPVGEGSDLGGIAASGGVYEGRARLISDVEDLFTLEQGDIIVAATTGEAFNSFLHLIGAIVTDHGSYACHAGIVAREAGCPAVVGTVNATSRIPDGATVRVDGEEGRVTIL